MQTSIKKDKRKTKVSLTQLQSSSEKDISTEGEDSPRTQTKAKDYQLHNKQKLQLCRKFSQFGYCPYNNKCKFAHGSHQLRKNNTANSKYKTKECITFSRDAVCHYGNRCNFKHPQKSKILPEIREEAINNYRSIFYQIKNQSKLLKLL